MNNRAKPESRYEKAGWMHFAGLGLVLLLSVTGCSTDGDSSKTSGAARAGKPDYRLKFDNGVGFYWAADGTTHFLYFPRDPKKRAKESEILKIPANVRFFSYGLDFSKSSLPPHLQGFGISYRERSGDYKGRWAANLFPVQGYDEPVYEIGFPQWPFDFLKQDAIEYEFWALEVASASTLFGSGSPEGYLFRFETAEYAKREKESRERLERGLSNAEVWHEGVFTSQTLIFQAQEVKFEIRFTGFDPETGEVDAQARGLGEDEIVGLQGELVSARRLVLRNARTGLVWDLDHGGGGFLSGTYSTALGQNSVSIRLAEEEQDEVEIPL